MAAGPTFWRIEMKMRVFSVIAGGNPLSGVNAPILFLMHSEVALSMQTPLD